MKSGQSKSNARRNKQRAARHRERQQSLEPLSVTIDYREDDGWQATLYVKGRRRADYRSPAVQVVFQDAMSGVNELADETGRPIATLHTLEGSAAAWGALALELDLQGLLDDSSVAQFVPVGD